MLENAWLIPALPGLSFVIILFFGKRLPRKGSEVGVFVVGVTLVLALVAAGQWIHHVNEAGAADHTAATHQIDGGGAHGAGDGPVVLGAASAQEGDHGTEATGGGDEAAGEHGTAVEPVRRSTTWWQNGGIEFKVGTLVDGLSILMMLVVTIVSFLVHVYSTDYVAGDRRYTHFFAFLSLFTASMLMLVVAENTLQMIIAWELVGLCSFVLIGHWWEEQENSDAALKAFLTNRVGDVGMLVGVVILFFAAGETFDIITINSLANAGAISHTALIAASLCLTAAVMSKSGQFFLHTWLPDAMAGPTPVSALIHAATMVVAGVFMVARMYGVFWDGYSIGSANFNVLALVGGVTTLVGAGLAFVQPDIKKVLAYSTISQLGYMVMALGVGAWTAAIFHLFTHAFFKACLFLGSGSVSHAVHSFDMKKEMGGMRKYMPQTYATFMIASLALAGLPPLAGFWSKDEILAGAAQLGGNGDGYLLMLVMGVVTAGLTAAYMTRCVYLTFFGEYRGHTPVDQLHESGPRITVPLWVLAGLAVVAGFANWPSNLGLPDGWSLRFEHYFMPVGAYFPTIALPEFSPLVAAISTLIVLGSIGVAYLDWFRQIGLVGITERNPVARAGYTFLENKYYLDHLYTDLIVGSVKGPVARAAYWFNQSVIDGIVNFAGRFSVGSGRWIYDRIDQAFVDGAVNGIGAGAEESGSVLRGIQTGRVQNYAALMFGGAVLVGIGVVAFVG